MEWHDFYLTVGGVSGALVGLLFVAMSVRARELRNTSLLGASKQAMIALFAVLVVSLLMLVPARFTSVSAIALTAIGAFLLPSSLIGQWPIARRRFTAAFALEAGGFDVCCAALVVAGIALLGRWSLDLALLLLAADVILLIGIALIRSWRLITGEKPSVVFDQRPDSPERLTA